MYTATGTFNVQLTPAPSQEGRASVQRMLLDKQFSGEFEGSAQGEMLSAGNPAAGAAAYVAIDHVNGRHGAREGGFALYHTGTMDKGAHSLKIGIVPGSGSGGFAGMRGELKLDIRDRVHHYTLEYTLDS